MERGHDQEAALAAVEQRRLGDRVERDDATPLNLFYGRDGAILEAPN
jgi:hypothetical protein